ncbi:MAG: hypothetical protein AAGJ93_01710, partial [Bacteroidota bacterium]
VKHLSRILGKKEEDTDMDICVALLSGNINDNIKYLEKGLITSVEYEKDESKFIGTFLMITDFLEDNQRLELIELLKQAKEEETAGNNADLTNFLAENQSDLKPVKITNATIAKLDTIENLLRSIESLSIIFYSDDHSISDSQRDNYFHELNGKYLGLTDESTKLFHLEKLFLEYSYRNASLMEIPEIVIEKCFDFTCYSADLMEKYRSRLFPIEDVKEETSFRKLEFKIFDAVKSISIRISKTKTMIEKYLIKTKTFKEEDYDPSMFMNFDYLMQLSLSNPLKGY